MADQHDAPHDEEKEKRWKKQLHRMGKILAKVWDFDKSEPFQEVRPPCTTAVLDLTTIGEKIDRKEYRLGKHGWEDFAKDLGGVYNRHMARKTKYAATAKEHLHQVKTILGDKDRSLSELASEHVPHEPESAKKRKAPQPNENGNDDHSGKKAKLLSPGNSSNNNKSDRDLTQSEREDNALEALKVFVEQKGGSRDQVESFRCRVTKKKSEGRYDVNYFNEEGRRFRSMLEVGRYLNLVKDAPVNHHNAGSGSTKRKGRKASSREQEAERKRLRKELDRLKREHQKAKKALDEFANEEKDTRYPIDDLLLQEEEEANNPKYQAMTPMTCAAARVPDLDGFPGVPGYCIPDVIMAWDFLCTFGRVLSLNPISLDDFAAALTYQPPESRVEEDAMVAPPVYLAEAHLGLLKLLLHDTSSDEWWWSILETDEADNRDGDTGEAANQEDKNMPVIKIDMAALLLEEEDPLITASWLGALEDVRNLKATDASAIKQAIHSALPVVANKWVKAYLRKARRRLKASRAVFTKRAVVWLVDHVREARPDLWSRGVKQETINQQRAKIVDDTALLMEKLESSAPAVTEDDLLSDADSEDYVDSDDSDDDEEELTTEKPASLPSSASRNFQDHPASAIPHKPSPSIVDILLPPHKPSTGDLINPFTWSQLAGATACRIFHRYKRLRNEVDDKLRDLRELSHLTVNQRRQREALAAIRIFSECVATENERNPLEKAMEHLSAGGAYLSLSTVERLCILRALIDAAYDTGRVYEVVDGNFKQRINAVKALEAEKRRAKREEKDEAAAAEAAARQQLVLEARAKFFAEKRIEIKDTNDQTREFDDDFIDDMTDDDIVEFDEDIKVEYQSLPGPDSFNKSEVNKMVVKMQEEAAFGTTSLTVVTMEELLEREKADLETMEANLSSLGGVDALLNPMLDRESSRTIERLRRDIERGQKLQETLPAVRAAAVESLRDAVQDGTLKALKAAVKQATTAKLCGEDHHMGGMWTLDILRDAKVEIKKAEKRKRLLEAQKELIAKRDKCFIRSEPQGRDRFRNRFWRFEHDDRGHLWVEADYILKDSLSRTPPNRDGYIDLLASESDISVGAEDLEDDLARDDENPDFFRSFCRREYHPTGKVKTLAKRHWGCQVTEKSLLAVIKKLDERGARENELKTNLKEALEDIGVASTDYSAGHLDDESENNGKFEVLTPATPQLILSPPDSIVDSGNALDIASSGDEEVFQTAKESVKSAGREGISIEVIDTFSTAIGQRVRVREVLKESKESAVCRYDNGIVNGWTFRVEQVADDHEEDEMPVFKNASVPYWRVATDRGRELWLSGVEVMESLSRFFSSSTQDKSYFEYDASFLTYRNSLGRHCGRASDAAVSSSPAFLAQIMVKREVELYTPLKNRVYDNNWGGKSGARNIWISQMKDFAYDLSSVRQGLLTLENAFFELTGQIAGMEPTAEPNGKALLHDTAKRFDIELETLEKSPQGIWSSHESRAVFQEIVQSCTTTGVLALSLDLLCRNCRAYLDANKMFDVRGSAGAAMSTRTTRRMNAWQQANNQNW